MERVAGRPSKGGFDAVIGNPPWDRIEQDEVEWFANRDSADSTRPDRSSTRKALIRTKKDAGDELALEHEVVRNRAAAMRVFVRSTGRYPLLSGGRTNLYSLFVERAMNLVKPDGFVGLLTPSGIYADKTAAKFFMSVSTSGRLASLFDFENSEDFLQGCPRIVQVLRHNVWRRGTEVRRRQNARSSFTTPKPSTDPTVASRLHPDDFSKVNPNTGTAPIFRTRRDAVEIITRRIYEQHPVLVDRSLR